MNILAGILIVILLLALGLFILVLIECFKKDSVIDQIVADNILPPLQNAYEQGFKDGVDSKLANQEKEPKAPKEEE